MPKVSSGSMDGVHPYTRPEFWTNPKNWYWWERKEMYTSEGRDYLFGVVRKAQKELDKHSKEDFLPQNLQK